MKSLNIKIKELVNKISNFSAKKVFFASIIILFLLMLILNFLTPLIADDFSYSFCLGGKRVGDLRDVFEYQVHHYLTWGGRSVVHGIAQTFLIFPKYVFNIFNTVVYLLLTLLIYKHIVGKERKYNPVLYIFINMLIWFGLPVFGQNILWLIGSCNYLWATTIVLLFLLPYRLSLDVQKKSNSIFKSILMLVLGIIAGWTNENTAAAMIFFIGLFILYKIYFKEKLSAWNITGLIGAICGFIIMIIAPGNRVRSEQFVDRRGFVSILYHRMLDITNNLSNFLLPLIIILIIVSVIGYYYGNHKGKQLIKTFFYTCTSIVSVYSMLLSPSFPSRSWMGPVIYMIIAIGIAYNSINTKEKFIQTIIIYILPITLLIYIFSFAATIIDTKNLNHDWNLRIKYIEEEKKIGNFDLEVYRIYSYNKHSALYELNDLGNDSKKWPNTSIARYFKLNSIKGKD